VARTITPNRPLAAAALQRAAARVDQHERFDVADDRRQAQTATVRVGSERAADGDRVHPGLLLANAPRAGAGALLALEPCHQGRPLDAGLDLDESLGAIEREHLIELGQVEQQRVLAELLAAHRMPTAGHADRTAFVGRPGQRRLHVVERTRRRDAPHARRVELRLHIVDGDAGGRGGAAGQRVERQAGGAERGAAGEQRAARDLGRRHRVRLRRRW
jgi:hypothetical protein